MNPSWSIHYHGDRKYDTNPAIPQFAVGDVVALGLKNGSDGPVRMGLFDAGKLDATANPLRVIPSTYAPAESWILNCIVESGPVPVAPGETRTVQFTVTSQPSVPPGQRGRYKFFVIDVSGLGSEPKHKDVMIIDPHVIITS